MRLAPKYLPTPHFTWPYDMPLARVQAPFYDRPKGILILNGSFEGHAHGRDDAAEGDGRLEFVIPDLEAEHEVSLLIGNTIRPIITAGRGREYQMTVHASRATPFGPQKFLIAMLLTGSTDLNDIRRGFAQGDFHALKIFPHGVSVDAGCSVRDIREIIPHLQLAAELKIPVHWHMERRYNSRGGEVLMRDREYYALKHDLPKILDAAPSISLTIEHVSDRRTIAKIYDLWMKGFQIFGGIATHYLYETHDALFADAKLRAHHLCWPIYKDPRDLKVLRWAACSGLGCYYIGNDFACHSNDTHRERGVKINSEGEVCGGVAIISAVSSSLLIDLVLEHADEYALDRIRSKNGMDRFCIRPESKAVYLRSDWVVPPRLYTPNGLEIVPYRREATMHWIRVM